MTQEAIRAEDVTWTDPTCPVARTVDLIGDRWSLLIVRDAMDGARSFTDFQQRTGIARNILTDRLRRLVERGILDRQTAPSGRRQVYTLTPAGLDLFTVIVALRQWGERHAFAPDEPRSVLVDELGLPVAPLQPASSSGNPADVGSTLVRQPRLSRSGRRGRARKQGGKVLQSGAMTSRALAGMYQWAWHGPRGSYATERRESYDRDPAARSGRH